MAQIKISELPTLAQQLQAANFVPVIHSGTTYKISLFNYLVKNSGDETIAGVKTFNSSPIVPTATTSTQAVNYGQVVKNSGDETIAGVKNFTSTPTVNSSPVRTDAIDSTIRSSISFTLPAMPDGARKRILNTHATNAITVTAYAGETIDGASSITLVSGAVIEIEKVSATEWRVTTPYSGSNTNGTYIKYPSGDIIQYVKLDLPGQLKDTSASAEKDWPIPFTVLYGVLFSVQMQHHSGSAIMIGVQSRNGVYQESSLQKAKITSYAYISETTHFNDYVSYNVVGMGRWK